jgi:hypothetical protein
MGSITDIYFLQKTEGCAIQLGFGAINLFLVQF